MTFVIITSVLSSVTPEGGDVTHPRVWSGPRDLLIIIHRRHHQGPMVNDLLDLERVIQSFVIQTDPLYLLERQNDRTKRKTKEETLTPGLVIDHTSLNFWMVQVGFRLHRTYKQR